MTWDRTAGHGQDIRGAPKCVRLGVLTEVTVKMTLFWDLTPCSLVDIYQHFGGVCWLSHFHQHIPWESELLFRMFVHATKWNSSSRGTL
jgi:hypothetical protein